MRALLYAAIALTLHSASFAQDALTLKERLSDKASDEQRVNNCQVPPERRGPVPRPGCPLKPTAGTQPRPQERVMMPLRRRSARPRRLLGWKSTCAMPEQWGVARAA